jgi:hypothetical protein
VPCIDRWNESFVPGLFKLNDVLSDMHGIVGVVVDAFVKSFVDYEANIDGHVAMGRYFWALTLRRLFPGDVFRTRMIEQFVEMLRRIDKTSYGRFELNKHVSAVIKKTKGGTIMRCYRHTRG